ncbi:hypothetical protein O9992_27230 [Vibrio lentus]|nr:hypothetical protein [Vibrio lentus]
MNTVSAMKTYCDDVMSAEFSVIPKCDRTCIGEYRWSGCSLIMRWARFGCHYALPFRTLGSKFTTVLVAMTEMMSPRAAIRWSLQGKHEGYGMFGKPTGKDVYIMGISRITVG